jgi:hypothetical protein
VVSTVPLVVDKGGHPKVRVASQINPMLGDVAVQGDRAERDEDPTNAG